MLHLQREYCGMSVADCCKCAQHCNVGGVDTVGVLSSKLAVAAMLSVYTVDSWTQYKASQIGVVAYCVHGVCCVHVSVRSAIVMWVSDNVVD